MKIYHVEPVNEAPGLFRVLEIDAQFYNDGIRPGKSLEVYRGSIVNVNAYMSAKYYEKKINSLIIQ